MAHPCSLNPGVHLIMNNCRPTVENSVLQLEMHYFILYSMRIIVNFHVVYNCILSFLFKKFRDTQILHYSNVRVKTNLRYFLSDMKQFSFIDILTIAFTQTHYLEEMKVWLREIPTLQWQVFKQSNDLYYSAKMIQFNQFYLILYTAN